MLNALAAARRDWVPDTPSIHSLGLGLPGYLILFAPLAFAPQRQETGQVVAFATGVPPDIYAFHRYTWNSTSLSHTQAVQYQTQFPG